MNDNSITDAVVRDDALKVVPDGYRISIKDVHYFLCAHELYTGCRLGIKRSRVYNVTNWVETYCCRNFQSCPFELKLYGYEDDVDSVYFKISQPHLHDLTNEHEKPFFSIEWFIRNNIKLETSEIFKELENFLNASLEKGDLIGNRHRFEYRKLPLGRTTAFILEDIIPKQYNIMDKKLYYRKEQKELERERQQLDQEENEATIQKVMQIINPANE